jgi:RNA polymerase sigma-70 factor (ECF subfamily)
MTRPPRQLAPESAAASADELQLLERLRAGDRAAFARLVQLHGGALLRLATTFVQSPAVAEEVVQDSWLAALDKLGDFEGRSTLRTWLFQIVANKSRTRGAREGRSVPFSSLAGAEDEREPAVSPDRFDEGGMWKEPPGPWSEQNPERLAQGVQTRAAIEQAIAALPEAQREVITLRDIEGLEAGEICNLLGVTLSNQRVLLHRARAKVGQALERYMAGER